MLQNQATGYIRIKELAEDIGVHRKTIQGWIKKGLPCYRPSHRLVLIKKSDLDEFLGQFKNKRNSVDDIVDSVVKDLI